LALKSKFVKERNGDTVYCSGRYKGHSFYGFRDIYRECLSILVGYLRGRSAYQEPCDHCEQRNGIDCPLFGDEEANFKKYCNWG
jgi:hypothetical protein